MDLPSGVSLSIVSRRFLKITVSSASSPKSHNMKHITMGGIVGVVVVVVLVVIVVVPEVGIIAANFKSPLVSS